MLDAIVHSLIPVLADVDVLVVGAGSAGCCAAIAASEAGLNVAIVDRYGFLGGTSTAVLDTFYGFYTPGDAPKKVVGGIPDRVLERLKFHDAMYLRPNTYGAGTGVTYNPEVLKRSWDELIFGCDVLLHCLMIDIETRSDGSIASCIVATRCGLQKITAKRYIDTSGDAELCHLAGIAYETAGETEPAQTLTTTFRLANVDLPRWQAAGGKKMLADVMAKTTHNLPRRKGSFHAMAIPGCASTVAARVADVNTFDVRELTHAEAEGRRQAFVYEKFVRAEVPGYENARIAGLSTFIGLRETRRVYGEYRLNRDDCMSVRRFDDKVLLCGAPIEDHRTGKSGEDETAWAYVPGNAAYDVPYRTLVPKGRDDVLVAGRCFSATHDAHASCRSMAQTMAMGHAVGVAAALSLKHDCSVRQVPIDVLQRKLTDGGAVLETPTEIASEAQLEKP
jgi:hypothetical protein